ncbi:MAG: rhomboid family intramembrane serine protease, partial [Leptospirales bacterium]|nr:rhomboid family intramembrane serine protease [Leptospirales bacterium]
SSYSNWTLKIIFINIAVFLIQSLKMNDTIPYSIGDYTFESGINMMNYYFGLIPALVVTKYYVWQFVTYMFLHGSFWHIFFNMYGVMIFGAHIENLWGTKKFLIYYFFTGIGAGITIAVVNFITGGADIFIPTIGASGAVFGLLLAFGILFPNAELLIFFVLPIKAKYLVFLYGAIELMSQIQVSSGGSSGISHLGHLGGLLFGLIFFVIAKRRGIKFSAKKMKAKMDKEIIERDKILNSDSEKTAKRLSIILRKLKEGGADAISDDEYQFIKLTDILHAEIHADESALCSPEDFDNNDEHCRKCETFESCLMREIKKYL